MRKFSYSSLAIRIQKVMQGKGVSTSRSHVTELIASAMGYGTYASLRAAHDPDVLLARASVVRCDTSQLRARAASGRFSADEIDAFTEALTLDPGPTCWCLNDQGVVSAVESVLRKCVVNSSLYEDVTSDGSQDTISGVRINLPKDWHPAFANHSGPYHLNGNAVVEMVPKVREPDQISVTKFGFPSLTATLDRLTPAVIALADVTVFHDTNYPEEEDELGEYSYVSESWNDV